MKKGWVVSSFGFSSSTETRNTKETTSTGYSNKKRPREKYPKSIHEDTNIEKTVAFNNILWINKYTPKIENELAVHKKKVEEVREWLLRTSSSNRKRNQILLLTGPSGCGKTATVRMLSNELNFGIKEWSNSNGLNYVYEYRVYGESQVSTFKDFLLLTSKYSSSQIFNEESNFSKYVVLLEEFPSFLKNDVDEFWNILRNYHQNAVHPLILVVTDDNKDSYNERKLLPKSFQDELEITNICFNQVAVTNLNRCLRRIADAENLSVPPELIDSISTNSHGDIRAAINALQFTYDAPHQLINKTKTKSRRKQAKLAKDECRQLNIGSRDESLFFLHALGKILHCKRAEVYDEKLLLPPNMKELDRKPLLTHPEEVWQRTSASVNTFLAFLHQNYMSFVNSIKNLEMSSDYLSVADMLDSEWTGYDTPTLNPYVYSVASRGVMFCSTNEKVGWKPLNKPQMLDVEKAITNTIKYGKSIYQESVFGVSTTELFSEIIPYISKIRPKNCTAEQINLAVQIDSGRDHKPFRKDSEPSEVNYKWDEIFAPGFQAENETMKQSSFEEFDIEEFDD
ncbi:Cell cycle checkpoint protein rad17 [Chamberlinius hualienensis]